MGCIVRKQKNVLSANIKTISSVMFSTSQRNSSQIINTRKKLKQKGPSAGPLSKISLEESFRQDSMEYTELASGILVPHSQTLKEKSEICKSLLGHFIFNSLSLVKRSESLRGRHSYLIRKKVKIGNTFSDRNILNLLKFHRKWKPVQHLNGDSTFGYCVSRWVSFPIHKLIESILKQIVKLKW